MFDLPALKQVLADIRSRRIRLVPVDTDQSSPMAQSLLFGWIAVYMYEGDAPLAERRAAALALDRDLLRELLGSEELRELIDPDVLADLELELQRLVDGRRARDADECHDLLRLLGPADARRARRPLRRATPKPWIDELVDDRRAYAVGVGGEERWAATEDAARLRDALGVAVPVGLPAAFTDPVDDPLGRPRGPVRPDPRPVHVAPRPRPATASPSIGCIPALERLEADGRVLRGEFRPGGHEREWTDPDVLRTLRRRSLAALRKEVEPVDGEALGRFLPEWHHVGSQPQGHRRPRRRRRPSSRARRSRHRCSRPTCSRPGWATTGRPTSTSSAPPARWCGSAPARSARATAGSGCCSATGRRCWCPTLDEAPSDGPVHVALLDHLRARGASFWSDLVGAAQAADADYDDATVLAALWDLVWAGTSPTTRSARCGPSSPGKPRRSSARSRGPAAVRGPAGCRGSARPPAPVAGRWSRRCSTRRRRPPRQPTPRPASCSSATAC